MVCPSPHEIFCAMFDHLPKEEFEIIEELWCLRHQLTQTKNWFSRYKIKSSIKKLEKDAFMIGIKWAIKDLEKHNNLGAY